ncbi:unnamed protein product [Macrosiphum euphorbiae]|uniref:Uncharacterized protein n=1 Tax=Macrosiphum euphorbiae TaxID=13131 RepID=A0AAV0XKG4_9HEMI|nr:unnamed protein product [Macrosiphum euphorbiae]
MTRIVNRVREYTSRGDRHIDIPARIAVVGRRVPTKQGEGNLWRWWWGDREAKKFPKSLDDCGSCRIAAWSQDVVVVLHVLRRYPVVSNRHRQ